MQEPDYMTTVKSANSTNNKPVRAGKALKEIEEIVPAPTQGQSKFSRPRVNLRSPLKHPVQGCVGARSVQSALSARRQGSSQRRRRLTTPLRVAQGSPLGGTAAPRKRSEHKRRKARLRPTGRFAPFRPCRATRR